MSLKSRLAGVLLIGALVAPGSALAAGNGYGPGNGTGGNQIGTGFTSVVTARTVSPKGAVIQAKFGGATITLTIPHGSFNKAVQVAITDATAGSVLRIVPKKDHLDAAFGVIFKGATPKHPVIFTISAKKFPANIEVFAIEGKKLVPVHFTIHNGVLSISVTGNMSLVIVTPPAKHK